MARLKGILMLSLLLTACGDGNDSTTPAVTDTPGTAADSALVAPVRSAPASIAWADTTLSAELYVNPENFIHPFMPELPTAAGIDVSLSTRNSNPDIPLGDQAGAFILLRAAKTGTVIDAGKIRRLIAVRGNKAYSLELSQVHLTDGMAQRLALTLPNGFTPDSLALLVDNGSAEPVWLAATVHVSGNSFRTYSASQLTGESNDTHFQPVLQSRLDFGGGAAALATLVMKAKVSLTEKQVIDGLLKYGETAKILERKGFSQLDFRLYLTALGAVASGYALTDPEADVATLKAEGYTSLMIPATLFGVRHYVILNHVDSGWIYVASPHFGNLAIPRAELDSVWNKDLAGTGYVLLAVKTPEGFSLPPGF